ncbi:sensor histidine kinase [Xylocopilactobacillus apicola]|uniref:histidine kinase n=1 Tax=Xylocopilactobacillus apicola TaxID=2932184 RepID=A0AAU9DUP2_9LACO|nr:sensor histidine kinase [Xylocopilactobacillus apicola]BDR59228.1 two-component sensor histidine kinase [Xylocopilactobacillus apicola]
MNYIWLIYLPMTMDFYLPVKSWHDLFWLLATIIFLIDYILVFEKSAWRRVTIPLELMITGAFCIFEMNFYMIIFSGWQLSYTLGHYPKKYFNWFCLAYYLCVGIGSIHAITIRHNNFDLVNVLFILIFVMFSPMMSYGLSHAWLRRYQLSQDKRRLEAIVRQGERDRIARDLHDTLGQSFSMITIKAELAQKLLIKRPEQVAGELSDIAAASRENLQLVRNIVNDLHQKSLTEVLLEQSKNLAAADLILITKGESEAVEWSTAVQNKFAEVLPEAITNIIRHAHAHEVQINFNEFKDRYQIIVHDDGRAKSFMRSGSHGITGMESRMLEAGGTFEISRERHGTEVQFEIFKDQK